MIATPSEGVQFLAVNSDAIVSGFGVSESKVSASAVVYVEVDGGELAAKPNQLKRL